MIKKIITDPKELSKPCKVSIDKIDHIVKDLLDTAKANEENCAGLAANQIGYDERVIVIKNNNTYVAMVNPVIKLKYGKILYSTETCLSFPGQSKEVTRSEKIKISFIDPINGSLVKKFFLNGLAAIIVQHEIDHLNGVLI